MQNFFSRKFAIFFLYSFLGVFFSLFFSYSVFAGVWDNSGGKHISSPTLTVVPNEVVTFGAGVYTGTILSLGGFSGEYSPAIGTSSKNFNVSSASGLTNYNHYIKSANSSQKIRLKKISSRTGYFNTGEKVGKLGCKTDSNSNAAVSYFCFHAQVEAVCTAPSGGDVFQGESYTENLAHGSVVKTCQSDWTFSEAAAVCTDGYTGSLCQTAPVPTCSSAEHLEDNVCVSNQQACEKANGIGKQYWNSETLDWDPSCSVDSCNDGYYKNPTNLTQCFEIIDGMCSSTKNTCEAGDYKNETNLATVFKWSCEGKNSGENESCSLSCASGEHIENDSCVSNSATCTVTNGSGRKSWNGSWGSCVPNTCNDGYFLSDGACQVVINDCAANTREGYLFTAFNHDTTQPVSKRDDLGNGDVRSYFATASCSDGEVSIAGESSQLECGEGREEKISGKCSPVVTYSWDEPNFPAFPADACGNTTVERTVSCKGADNGNYADSFCAGQTKPAESKTEDKGDEVCGWSEFSEFSAIAACDKGNGKQEYIKSRTCSLVTDLESANHCQGEAAVTEFREECKKCELDGVSIIHGSAQNFWNYETIQYGSSDECFVSARKCNNGELEGLSDYRYKSQCVIVDTIDIDIAVLDRKNFSERQVIAPNGEIDTDFEIIVSNDSIENSSYLAQKEVKFSVEWDSEIFSLPNIDDFDGTRDDPKANDTSDNFECYTEGSRTQWQ